VRIFSPFCLGLQINKICLTPNNMKTIAPRWEKIHSFGKIMYHESAKAHVLLRFKKRIINLFPQLKEKKEIFYELQYCWDYKKTIDEIYKAKYDKKGVPLILYIYGDKNEQRD